MPVITKIYEQTADLLRRKVNPCLGKQTDYIGGGQLKSEMKGEGRLLTLDEFKAERTYFTPERKRAVFYLVLLFGRIVCFLKGTVYFKCIKSSNAAFQKKETVKGFTEQQFFHKDPDIGNLKCNHKKPP